MLISNEIIRLRGLLSIHGEDSPLALWLGGKHVLGAILSIVPRLPTFEADILTGIASPVVIFPTFWAAGLVTDFGV